MNSIHDHSASWNLAPRAEVRAPRGLPARLARPRPARGLAPAPRRAGGRSACPSTSPGGRSRTLTHPRPPSAPPTGAPHRSAPRAPRPLAEPYRTSATARAGGRVDWAEPQIASGGLDEAWRSPKSRRLDWAEPSIASVGLGEARNRVGCNWLLDEGLNRVGWSGRSPKSRRLYWAKPGIASVVLGEVVGPLPAPAPSGRIVGRLGLERHEPQPDVTGSVTRRHGARRAWPGLGAGPDPQTRGTSETPLSRARKILKCNLPARG